MITGFAILFVLYFACVMSLIYGSKKIVLLSSEKKEASISFSIVIPFRNEVENLPRLLISLEKLKYPRQLFEVIFVNDNSEDNSEALIYEAIENSKVSIVLLQNNRISASPKKDAITEAIRKSNFEWIVTTDADCSLPVKWLSIFNSFIMENNVVMVCGPVKYKSDDSFIQMFQQLDGLSLQTVTMGSFGLKNPILSNGANLAYSKDDFFKVKGFSGNDHIASGDDIFLLEKMKKMFPEQIHFLKSNDAIVETKPQKDWKDLLNQRVRWASKTSKQQNLTSVLIGILVLFTNISILLFPIMIIFHSEKCLLYFLLIAFKIMTDFILLRQNSKFFDIKIPFWKFPFQTFIYALVAFIVVFKSIFGTYSWKGRNFNIYNQTKN